MAALLLAAPELQAILRVALQALPKQPAVIMVSKALPSLRQTHVSCFNLQAVISILAV
jgi:hypothetical protein